MITWLGHLLIVIGVLFALVGSIGLYRLPDFYTRAHAASKTDTLGIIATMIGLALLTGFNINGLKLLLIALFTYVANPAASHALGHAAVRTGLQPWLRAKPGDDVKTGPA